MNFLFQFCEKQMATMAAVCAADEIWTSNPNKNMILVLKLDGSTAGDRLVCTVWKRAMNVYEAANYDD